MLPYLFLKKKKNTNGYLYIAFKHYNIEPKKEKKKSIIYIYIYIYILLTTSEKAMINILFLIFNNVYSVTLFKVELIDQYNLFFFQQHSHF